MSTTRARSAATDEADASLSESNRKPSASPSGLATEEQNGEEAEEEEEDAGSGDSSSAAHSRSRSAKKKNGGGGKGAKRDKLSAPVSRSRHSKASQSVEADATEGDAVQKFIKQETANSEGEDDGTAEYVDQEGRRHTRRRSASGLKELAGLGLQNLGDGAEAPLMPRRSRRSGTGQNEGGVRKSDSEEADGEPERSDEAAEEINVDTANVEQNAEESEEKPTVDVAEASAVVDASEALPTEEEEGGDEGVTRCLCGSADENVGLMIQCETCKCWQHCICMGMRTEEDCPDVYFCEQCRPELHVPLLRLLGVLPAKNGKKANVGKTVGGRPNARDSSKELKDAKDAVLTLAKENERRRQEGREPVTGWSVAQEQEYEENRRLDELSGSQQSAQAASLSAQRRQGPDSTRVQRSTSRDDVPVPRSPPKRRSTMNSRDSVYGWEPIPPGLLNEDEVWEEQEEKEEANRKRKRSSREDDVANAQNIGQSSVEATMKRRRTSPSFDSIAEENDEENEGAGEAEDAEERAPASQPIQRAVSTNKGRTTRETDRPRHPNQYTKRAAAAAAAAAAAETGASSESTSPGPSPHKTRAEGMRRSTRETAASSRTGTPAPGEHHGRRGDGTWALPEHLSHLAHLLPPGTGPEPLKVSMPTAKPGPKGANAHTGGTSGATRDPKTDRIIKASPQPFNVINLTESSTKIKYPGKRMTMGEMRKRVRNILEFVQRLQIESVDRERRMRFLGISRDQNSDSSAAAQNSSSASPAAANEQTQADKAANIAAAAIEKESETAEGVAPGSTEADLDRKPGESAAAKEEKVLEDVEMQVDEVAATRSTEVVDPVVVVAEQDLSDADHTNNTTSALAAFANLADTGSMALVDELTRELLAFQTRFGAGTAMALSSSLGY